MVRLVKFSLPFLFVDSLEIDLSLAARFSHSFDYLVLQNRHQPSAPARLAFDFIDSVASAE